MDDPVVPDAELLAPLSERRKRRRCVAEVVSDSGWNWDKVAGEGA